MRFILISIFFINSLLACSVCYGSPDEPAVKAAQAGILFLLCVVGFVLSGFAIFMYNLSRKEQKV
tara:strand:- start:197 stop:391 length:195 start_codon:yes stop_codon:yes gene_type:complete